jgi:curved DNA-binding protein CbpA
MTAERDPYAVLGVRSSATTDEIAAAYRSKARLHHPDVSSAGDAERRMAEINSAWTVLRDPARRAAWDRANELEPPTPSNHRPPARPNGTTPAPASARTRPGTVTWRRGPAGEGAAGPPPGGARGSVLPFGRHIGWSLGEVARVDPGYLVWLKLRREGAPYREEIERFLAAVGATPSTPERAGRARRGVVR